MRGEILVDTNVLVYAYDRAVPAKQFQARGIVNTLARSGSGRLTTQVLGEFFVVITRRLKSPFSPRDAYAIADDLMRGWPVISMTALASLEAMRAVRDHSLSFYDAQLWATAKLNQIPVILTEDFQDNQVLEGVRFVNPFARSFRLADWVL